MKKSKEIKAQIDELNAEVQAIVDIAREESRDLDDNEKARVDAIQGTSEAGGEISALQADLERAVRFESRVKEIQNQVGSTLGQPKEYEVEPSNSLEQVKVPAKAKVHRELQAFNGPDAERNAFIAGHCILGGILGRESSVQFMRDHGIHNAMSSTDGLKGGFLVPEEMEAALVRLRDARGVFPRFAANQPMGSEVTTVNRLIGDVTAYWGGKGAEITASDAEAGQAKLVADKLSTLTKLDSELGEDAIVDVGDMIVQSAAYAMADKIDQAGFNGDATSTYGGTLGLANALNSSAVQDAASGNVSAATLDLSDFEQVCGLLPEYGVAEQPRWFMSKTAYWNSARRLMDAAGGNTVQTLADGQVEPMFLGYPVTFAQVMSDGSSVSTIVAYFGHLNLCATLGRRRGVSLAASTDRYFENDQIGIKTTQRVAITVHERGDTVRTRPVVALKTAAS